MGLVNRVVPAADLDTAAAEVVNDLLALSRESLRLTRQALSRSGVRPTRDEIEQSERFYVEQLMNTPDAIEGLKAFLEKRTARWDSQARAHTEDAHADS
jgi:cyclohexa-1,5-dienecarbonyl-CoA hydratase